MMPQVVIVTGASSLVTPVCQRLEPAGSSTSLPVIAKRPKARYAAPFSAKAIIAAATLLPDRVFDAGLLNVMSRLGR